MSSPLSAEAVRHVAHLARLTVSEDEVALFVDQLSKILDYMELLGEVDTSSTPPTTHTLPVSNVFRQDRAHEPLTSEETLHNAPQQQDGFFRVPKVLKVPASRGL